MWYAVTGGRPVNDRPGLSRGRRGPFFTKACFRFGGRRRWQVLLVEILRAAIWKLVATIAHGCGDDPAWNRHKDFGHILERLGHVVDPDRQGGNRPGFVST